MYRPGTQHPNLTYNEQFGEFVNLLSSILDHVPHKAIFYIFGDINLDCLKFGKCPMVDEYLNRLFSYSLLQLVPKPTRCTPNSATVIDHVISNNVSSPVNLALITTFLSDHFPVACQLDDRLKRQSHNSRPTRLYTEEAINSFKNALYTVQWHNVFSEQDPQLALNHFDETFFALYNI
jgi:hypothetical protein